MRTRVVLVLALVACSAPRPRPPRGDPVLSIEGRVENGPFVFGKDDLPDLPRRAFAAAAPLREVGESARFEGVTFPGVLSATMEVMGDADLAVFHGADGTVAAVPMAVLRQLRPVLADRVNGAEVPAWRAGARPLQLAWPNLDHPGIDSDPRMRGWWLSGVGKVVLQSWRNTYGRALRVPAGSPDEARLGAGVLSTHCMGCHRVRGAGGTRAPELTGRTPPPRSALPTMRDHLRKHAGPAPAPELSAAEASAAVAFLEAVARSGGRDDDGLPATPPVDEPLPAPTAPPRGGYRSP